MQKQLSARILYEEFSKQNKKKVSETVPTKCVTVQMSAFKCNMLYISSAAEALVSEEWPWRRKILYVMYQFVVEGKSEAGESAASEHLQETLECSDENSDYTGEQVQDS